MTLSTRSVGIHDTPYVFLQICEQIQKLNDMKEHVMEITYEWELRRLKKLQLIRVKQFKHSMLDRLKKQKLRRKQMKKVVPTKVSYAILHIVTLVIKESIVVSLCAFSLTIKPVLTNCRGIIP